MRAMATTRSTFQRNALRDRTTEPEEYPPLDLGMTARAGSQPRADSLQAFAALSGAADTVPYFVSDTAMALTAFPAFGRELAGAADSDEGRGVLELDELLLVFLTVLASLDALGLASVELNAEETSWWRPVMANDMS